MRSIIPGGDEKRCFICNRWLRVEKHHCLHGSRRKMADKYGLTVYLCVRCHTRLHDLGEHDLELERIGQRAFEEKYGHERFMKVFGKDYTA